MKDYSVIESENSVIEKIIDDTFAEFGIKDIPEIIDIDYFKETGTTIQIDGKLSLNEIKAIAEVLSRIEKSFNN